MRRYSSFSALVQSFFSADLYRDVAHGWRGVGFLHLLLVLLLINVPLTARIQWQMRGVEGEVATLVKDFPEIRLAKGEVSADVPQPYEIREPGKDGKPGKVAFVLDTTGQIKSPEDTTAAVLITKSHLFVRNPSSHEERGFDLKGAPDFVLNKVKLVRWAGLFAEWFGAVVFVVLMACELAWGVFAISMLALFGAMVGGSRSTVSTAGYLRLAAIARTPYLLLDALLSLLSIPLPLWFFISTAMSFGYMVFAVNSANEIPQKPFDLQEPPVPPQPDCFTAPPQA